jgi:hypothetical protein
VHCGASAALLCTHMCVCPASLPRWRLTPCISQPSRSLVQHHLAAVCPCLCKSSVFWQYSVCWCDLIWQFSTATTGAGLFLLCTHPCWVPNSATQPPASTCNCSQACAASLGAPAARCVSRLLRHMYGRALMCMCACWLQWSLCMMCAACTCVCARASCVHVAMAAFDLRSLAGECLGLWHVPADDAAGALTFWNPQPSVAQRL